MRNGLVFLLVFALSPLARAGPEIELGGGGIISASLGGPALRGAQDTVNGGAYGEGRLGWRFDSHAGGVGLRLAGFPNARGFDDELYVPHLYFREFLHGELAGTTVEIGLGLAPVTHCGGDFCDSTFLPMTDVGFGLPIASGFGDLLFKLGVGFLVDSAGAASGARVFPLAGLSYLL